METKKEEGFSASWIFGKKKRKKEGGRCSFCTGKSGKYLKNKI